jgi:plasmid stability protein
MAQIMVRDLDPKVVNKLKSQAKKNGRSLQAEVKLVLTRQAHEPTVDMETASKILAKFRKRFKGKKFSDSAELIREDRDR